VLGLTAWKAFPTLAEAWQHDLYARGAPLAFAIWLATQAWLFFKNRGQSTDQGIAWLGFSLLLCAAGSLSGLRVLHHLALATAVPGLLGLRFAGLATTAAALAWLPASGWFISHWKSGGLTGWERPVFVTFLSIILLVRFQTAPKTLHSNLPQP
jgi:hypothetical protein